MKKRDVLKRLNELRTEAEGELAEALDDADRNELTTDQAVAYFDGTVDTLRRIEKWAKLS